MPRPHQIGKLIIELDVKAIDDAYAVQNDASSFLRNEVTALLSVLLDKHDIPGKIIRIDKLELDVRDIGFTPEGRYILRDELQGKLDEQLSRMLQRFKFNPSKNEIGLMYQNGILSASEAENISVYNEADDTLAALLFFLQKGYFPWWAGWMLHSNLNDVFSSVMSEHKKIFAREVIQNSYHPFFLRRLFIQIPKVHMADLAREIVLHYSDFSSSQQTFGKNREVSAFFEMLHSTSPVAFEETLLSLYEGEVAEKTIHVLASLQKMNAEEKKKIAAMLIQQKSGLLTEEKIMAVLSAVNKADAGTTANKKKPASNNDTENETKGNKKAFSAETEDETESGEIISEEPESNYTPAFGCGLVLIQPYLVPFFKTLQLTNGKTFYSEKEQCRAVYLLHYLATGVNEDPGEHRLVIPKILCGIPLEKPVESFMNLTESEIQECESLLVDVVENWKALKNTAAQTLREMYLKREGNYRFENNQWIIHIEREAADVLLDKLPWGISMLKAPWNENMIYVEW